MNATAPTRWASLGIAGIDRDPITATPETFAHAKVNYERLARDVQSVVDAFDQVSSTAESSMFAGDAATALRGVISEVNVRLKIVPTFARSVATILSEHERELEGIKAQATVALARARTAWTEAEQSRQAVDTASASLKEIERQIDSLGFQGLPEEIHESERIRLESTRDFRFGELQSHRRTADHSDSVFADFKETWRELHDSERSLDTKTAQKLDSVDLGDLGDSFWDDLSGAIGDAANWLYEASWLDDIIAAAVAAYEAIPSEFFYTMRKWVSRVAFAVGTAAMIAGFLLGGPLAWATIATLGIGGLQLLLTATIVIGGHKDEHGNTLGYGTLGLEALMLVGSALFAIRGAASSTHAPRIGSGADLKHAVGHSMSEKLNLLKNPQLGEKVRHITHALNPTTMTYQGDGTMKHIFKKGTLHFSQHNGAIKRRETIGSFGGFIFDIFDSNEDRKTIEEAWSPPQQQPESERDSAFGYTGLYNLVEIDD